MMHETFNKSTQNAKIKAVADPFLSEEADKKAKAAGAEYTTKDCEIHLMRQKILMQ